MEMIAMMLSNVSAGQTAHASVNASQGTTNQDGRFQHVLSGQIAANTATSPEQKPLIAYVNGTDLVSGVTVISETGHITVADLMLVIDDLLNHLTSENEDDESSEKQLDTLLDLQDKLNSILSLIGIPGTQPQLSSQTNIVIDNESDALSQSLSSLKGTILDSLIHLQSGLEQGISRSTQNQSILTLVAEQLSAIKNVLVNNEKLNVQGNQVTEQEMNAGMMKKPDIQSDSIQLLQRMTQHTNQTAMLQTIADEGHNTRELSGQHGATQSNPESSEVIPLNLMNQAQLKSLSSLVSNTATPSNFVLVDDFADTLQGLIVQKFTIQTLNGSSEAKLKLFPEQLGQVDVRIMMQNGILTAAFHTDTVAAKDLLENQMSQLRASLQAQGLHVEKLEVSQSSSTALLSGQASHGGNKGQDSSSNQQKARNGERLFDTAFEVELTEQTAIQSQGLGMGRSINEIA